MSESLLPRPHGGVRGADLSRASLLFGGPFGRIFRALPPADFGKDDQASLKALKALAAGMLAHPDPIPPRRSAWPRYRSSSCPASPGADPSFPAGNRLLT